MTRRRDQKLLKQDLASPRRRPLSRDHRRGRAWPLLRRREEPNYLRRRRARKRCRRGDPWCVLRYRFTTAEQLRLARRRCATQGSPADQRGRDGQCPLCKKRIARMPTSDFLEKPGIGRIRERPLHVLRVEQREDGTEGHSRFLEAIEPCRGLLHVHASVLLHERSVNVTQHGGSPSAALLNGAPLRLSGNDAHHVIHFDLSAP